MDLTSLDTALNDLRRERLRVQSDLNKLDAAISSIERVALELNDSIGQLGDSPLAAATRILFSGGLNSIQPGGTATFRNYFPAETVSSFDVSYAAAAHEAMSREARPMHIKELLPRIAKLRGVAPEKLSRASVESSLHKAMLKGPWAGKIRKIGAARYEALANATDKGVVVEPAVAK